MQAFSMYQRVAVAALAACVTVLLLYRAQPTSQHLLHQFAPPSVTSQFTSPSDHHNWTFDTRRDADNYGLTSEQCDIAFPNLFADIDRAVQSRQKNHITQGELTRHNGGAGMARVLVWDEKVRSSSKFRH